jgi:hypothetical protein
MLEIMPSLCLNYKKFGTVMMHFFSGLNKNVASLSWPLKQGIQHAGGLADTSRQRAVRGFWQEW